MAPFVARVLGRVLRREVGPSCSPACNPLRGRVEQPEDRRQRRLSSWWINSRTSSVLESNYYWDGGFCKPSRHIVKVRMSGRGISNPRSGHPSAPARIHRLSHVRDRNGSRRSDRLSRASIPSTALRGSGIHRRDSWVSGLGGGGGGSRTRAGHFHNWWWRTTSKDRARPAAQSVARSSRAQGRGAWLSRRVGFPATRASSSSSASVGWARSIARGTPDWPRRRPQGHPRRARRWLVPPRALRASSRLPHLKIAHVLFIAASVLSDTLSRHGHGHGPDASRTVAP